jgi:peroxiredoxin
MNGRAYGVIGALAILTTVVFGPPERAESGLNATQEAAPEKPGLPIGQRAPAFTLKDQNDKDVSLESLLEKGPVSLVFFRSADWCLYCKLQVIQLQRNLKEIEASGGQVVAISFDSADVLKRFAKQNKITLPLLSDAGSKTIDAFDIRDKQSPLGNSYHGTFVIDQQGVIRAKLFQVSYQERPAVETLVKTLKEARNMNGEQTQ